MKYSVKIPSNPIITSNNGFKITLNIDNYLKEPVVFSYIYRYDIPDSCVIHKVEPFNTLSYSNSKITIIATITENSKDTKQLIFEIPESDISNGIVTIHELGIMITTDKCKHLLLDKLSNNNTQAQMIRSTITDEESNLLFSCLANDPFGKLNKWFLCLNGLIVPIKFTHMSFLPKQLKFLLKLGNNTIVEHDIPKDQFDELVQKNSAIVIHLQKGGYMVIGSTYEETITKYKDYLDELASATYQSVKSNLDIETSKNQKQIEHLNSKIDILTTEKKTIENNLNRKNAILQDRIEELELENKTLHKKLKELGISTEITLSKKKLDTDLKKIETEMKKYETLKNVAETNKELAKIKKEKETVTKQREINKTQYEQSQMKHKEIVTGLEISKEVLKYLSVFVTSAFGVYATYSMTKSNKPPISNELLKTIAMNFKNIPKTIFVNNQYNKNLNATTPQPFSIVKKQCPISNLNKINSLFDCSKFSLVNKL